MDELLDIVIDTTVDSDIKDSDENTKLSLFDKKYLPVMLKIREMNDLKKDLDDKLTEIKESLGIMMDKYDIKSVKNSVIGITRVSSSTSISFDMTRFKKEEPKLYEELFNKYHKTSTKKAYTKIET